MYDILIIGSGLSGLHCAYQLQHTFKKICILEKEGRIGGRIQTVHTHGMSMEAGAGRFNQHHECVHKLIKALDLESAKIEIPSDLEFTPSGSTYNSGHKTMYKHLNPFDILSPILKKGYLANKQKLRTQTFMEFARSVEPNVDHVQFILDSFGYYEQLVHMNAYDALKLFDKGMHTRNKFYTLREGMSSIIESLCNRIPDVPIYTGHEVNKIEYVPYEDEPHFLVSVQNRKTPYKTRQCICAIPQIALKKIPFFRVIRPLLDTIGVKILCRIYAIFDPNDNWFEHIPKTTTNNGNRYIIPINREKGLIMIAYTDSVYAKYWKSLSSKPDAVFSQLQQNIQDTFGFTIGRPKYLKAFYWETGTAFWKPHFNSDELYKKIMKPIHSMPLYICGENFSQSQGWMEGALETSWDVIRMIERDLAITK